MATRSITRREFLVAITSAGVGGLAGCSDMDQSADDSDQSTSTDGDTGSTDGDTGGTDDDTIPVDLEVSPIVEGLTHPWGIAIPPDESMLLVTQRSGTLSLIDPDTGSVETVSGTPTVVDAGQGGLLDIALDPAFPDEPWVYLTYASTQPDGSTTALARGQFVADDPSLTDLTDIYVAEPAVDSTQHYGSRITFDSDGYLYMSVGDRGIKDFSEEHPSQRLDEDPGSILRLERDGSIPDDNPFLGDPDARSAIFTYGHRNPQGLTTHPETGELWITDHGEQDGDSISVLEEGGNYGWPIAHYGCTYDGGTPIGDQPHDRDDIVDPVHYWECNSGGFPPAGLTVATENVIESWQGDLLVGTLAGAYLGRFLETNGELSEREQLLAEHGWRIRDVVERPSAGELYVAVDDPSGPLVRIRNIAE